MIRRLIVIRAGLAARLGPRGRQILTGIAVASVAVGVLSTIISADLVVRICGAVLAAGGCLLGLAVVSVPARGRRRSSARPHVPVTADERLLADYAALARSRRNALVATLERTRSVAGRRVLAAVASGGRRDLAGILATLAEFRDPALRPTALASLEIVGGRGLAALARLLLIQRSTPQDVQDAATIFDLLTARGDQRITARSSRLLYAEALLAAGRRDDASRLIRSWPDPDAADWRVLADTTNPFSGGDPTGEAPREWLDAVNHEWADAGLEVVRILFALYLALSRETT